MRPAWRGAARGRLVTLANGFARNLHGHRLGWNHGTENADGGSGEVPLRTGRGRSRLRLVSHAGRRAPPVLLDRCDRRPISFWVCHGFQRRVSKGKDLGVQSPDCRSMDLRGGKRSQGRRAAMLHSDRWSLEGTRALQPSAGATMDHILQSNCEAVPEAARVVLDARLPAAAAMAAEVENSSQAGQSVERPATFGIFGKGPSLTDTSRHWIRNFFARKKASKEETLRQALLSESWKAIPALASHSPSRSAKHPFSKVIGIKPKQIIRAMEEQERAGTQLPGSRAS